MSLTSRQATIDASPSEPTAESTPTELETVSESPEPTSTPTSSSDPTPSITATESPESAEPTTSPTPTATASPDLSTSPEPSVSPDPSGSPDPTESPEASPSPEISATPEAMEPAWICPEPVSGTWATPGNNSVAVSWEPPANAEESDVVHYYVQVASSRRVIRTDVDAREVQVSGLRNGVEESFTVYASTQYGRSEASSQVSATPTSGIEGEVAGLIVKFTDPAPIAAGEANVPGKDKVTAVDLAIDSKITDDVHLVELSEAVPTEQANEVAAQLQSDPSVEWAEPDVFVFPSSTTVNDPQFETQQWNLWDEFGLAAGASDPGDMFTPEAGAGTTVAVIDTGITSHPDLDSQLVPGYDFVSNPPELAAPRTTGGPDVDFDADGQPGRDADPTDPGDWREVAPVRNSTWHGTHIAGVIAAQADNSEGIVGVAPGAKIQPIRALSWRGGLLSDIIASITWASGGKVDGAPANAKPADVITMSFAANTRCSAAMQTAIDDANARGSILVAAAGNANDDVANYTPANCADVVAVAATGRDGKRAPYSNHGVGIDIAAPGGALTSASGVYSTINTGTRSADAAGYASREGTSIAAAHVAGVIAQARSSEPGLSSGDLRARFLNGEQTRTFPDVQCDTDPKINCGTGLLLFVDTANTQPGVTYVSPFEIDVDADAFGSGVIEVPFSVGDEVLTANIATSGSLEFTGFTGSWTTAPAKAGFNLTLLLGPGAASASFNVVQGFFRNPVSINLVTAAPEPSLGLSPKSYALDACEIFPDMTVTPADFSGPVTYSVSPALPPGLEINSSTGVISGSATSISPDTPYTITANGPDGESATATVDIAVEQALSPCNQVITVSKRQDVSSAFAVLNTAGFSGSVTYSASGLPSELEIDSATGVISGEFVVLASNEWVVTVTATDGQDTAEATVTIRLVGLSPQGGGTLVGSVGQSLASAALTPKYFTNPPEFSITSGGSLPAGLSLDTTNGQISGTPTEVFDARDFTITATNPNDVGEVASAEIRISVPGFSPSSLTLTATVGQPVNHAITVAWEKIPGTVSFHVDPPLPEGLSLFKVGSTTTRAEIRGTPVEDLASKSYTLRAFNGKGSLDGTSNPDGRELLTDTITIVIDPAPTATVNYSAPGVTNPSPETVVIGTQVQLPTPSRAGFTFDGWFTEATGGERVGGGGDTYTVTANTTLYARWNAIPAASEPSSPSEPEEPPTAPPAFDQAPPRVELETPVRPTPARPGSLVVDGVEQELVVERDEDNTELDVTGEGFELTVSTSDTERARIAPTAQRTLVAPVRGFVELNASGYAPESMVSLYLVPALSPRFSGQSSTDPYFLGMTSVDVNQAFADEFQLPDWASAGEYALQINGYRPTGEVKSINVRLDLIDKRADAVSVARGCVFPESTVRLTTECRQSLRSLKQVLPQSIDTLTIEITGVAYAQGNKKKNRAVALERAERVERFLKRHDIVGDVTIDVVTRKGLVPGFAITPPPPVMVADTGKPATTVLMTIEWTTEIGPELALQPNG